nr:MAG TPA: cAMP-dependent protein kinase type I [Caudoviricetes sp.]
MENRTVTAPAILAAGAKQEIANAVNRALSTLPFWVVELIIADIHSQVSAGAQSERAAATREQSVCGRTTDKTANTSAEETNEDNKEDHS